MEAEYKISLEVFEGPLDLLLYLIKKEEVDIYDVSLERITHQYLQYLEALEVLNIEVAGDFVVMAANLLYIKSRTLLPKDQQMPEEDVEEDDPRWELIRQLIEYKKFKEAAAHLRDQEALQGTLFPRPGILPGPELLVEGPLLLNEVSIFDLINAFQKALKRLPKEEASSEIYEEAYTVADRMQHLLRMITPRVSIPFQELFSSATSRSEMVVTFLAMLELIRMKHFVVSQKEQFGEIMIERLEDKEESEMSDFPVIENLP